MQLYHGTSLANADLIMQEGFKDRIHAKRKNWKGDKLSQKGMVYLTRAYAFWFGMCAAKEQDTHASLLLVEVDPQHLYPDEDFLRWGGVTTKRIDIRKYQHLATMCLEKLGNAAAEPKHLTVLGRRDFNLAGSLMYSDPTITVMNYKIKGEYYRTLTDTWWQTGQFVAESREAL